MKDIEISIKIIDISKTISLKTSKNKKIETVLENILKNEKLDLPKQSENKVDISYSLWYGNQNASIDGLKFIDFGVENGDVFVMKSVLGKHDEKIKKKPWFRSFSKKQAGLIALILLILISSSLVYIYKEDIFTSKLNAKQTKINNLNNKVEKYEDEISKMSKENNKEKEKKEKEEEKKEKEKIEKAKIQAEKDSLKKAYKPPSISNIEVDYYDKYQSLLNKNNSDLYKNIKYIEISFLLKKNSQTPKGYEYFYVSIETNGKTLSNNKNILPGNVKYTTKIQAYIANEPTKITFENWNCGKNKIYRGTYNVKIYSKQGILLKKSKIEI